MATKTAGPTSDPADVRETCPARSIIASIRFKSCGCLVSSVFNDSSKVSSSNNHPACWSWNRACAAPTWQTEGIYGGKASKSNPTSHEFHLPAPNKIDQASSPPGAHIQLLTGWNVENLDITILSGLEGHSHLCSQGLQGQSHRGGIINTRLLAVCRRYKQVRHLPQLFQGWYS